MKTLWQEFISFVQQSIIKEAIEEEKEQKYSESKGLIYVEVIKNPKRAKQAASKATRTTFRNEGMEFCMFVMPVDQVGEDAIEDMLHRAQHGMVSFETHNQLRFEVFINSKAPSSEWQKSLDQLEKLALFAEEHGYYGLNKHVLLKEPFVVKQVTPRKPKLVERIEVKEKPTPEPPSIEKEEPEAIVSYMADMDDDITPHQRRRYEEIVKEHGYLQPDKSIVIQETREPAVDFLPLNAETTRHVKLLLPALRIYRLGPEVYRYIFIDEDGRWRKGKYRVESVELAIMAWIHKQKTRLVKTVMDLVRMRGTNTVRFVPEHPVAWWDYKHNIAKREGNYAGDYHSDFMSYYFNGMYRAMTDTQRRSAR